MINGHCVRPSHAEENAIANASALGVSTSGATCFVTHSPCWNCFRLLAQAGLKEIVFGELKTNGFNREIYEEMIGTEVLIRTLRDDLHSLMVREHSDLIT
jgi:deoxycytidylate deaminase